MRSEAQTHQKLSVSDELLLERVQRATFQYFLDWQNKETGLIYDRSHSGAFASIAGVGFALTSYAIAVERRWIDRQEAVAYTLKVLRTFSTAPQGNQPSGTVGCRGLFYHFLDPNTAQRACPPRWNPVELSSIDTALLFAGVLFAREYYRRRTPAEREIRNLAGKLLEAVEWPFLLKDDLTIRMSWDPETGMSPHVYCGFTEAPILYLLAIGSKTHPIPPAAWQAQFHSLNFESRGGKKFFVMKGMPLFCYQYPHCWIDFRGIRDEFNRRHNLDYFENAQRATRAQHLYARQNPGGWLGYGSLDWGLTACDGPGDLKKVVDGRERQFFSYRARGGPDGDDDGTIAPTAAISSIAYAPQLVLRTLRHWLKNRPELFNRHGFADAFNPTFDATKPSGWVDPDRLAIDQGPIVLMIENFRTGFVWKTMRRSRYLKRALRRAGFVGGWTEPLIGTTGEQRPLMRAATSPSLSERRADACSRRCNTRRVA